jgi:oligopeptide/dipeptide ABC transporter ATP-binding protein
VALLEIEDLRVEFGAAAPVDGVSLALDAGRTLGLVGESGCGKTLTALAVMRLVPRPGHVGAGRIRFDGRDLLALDERAMRAIRGRAIGMVFQEPMTALNPVLAVGAQIAEAAAVHGAGRAAARARAIEMLRLVEIPDPERRADAYPHQLSGGMRQRVMLAMALVNRPQVLIADEPTTALDVTTQAQILELLSELQQEMGLALVIVSHDLGVVAGVADRVVVMYAGRVVEEGTAERVFTAAGHPYTRGLLASVPRADGGGRALAAIPGNPPDPTAIPAGCPFHPRCVLATEQCRERRPPLRALGEGHRAACLYADEVSIGVKSV